MEQKNEDHPHISRPLEIGENGYEKAQEDVSTTSNTTKEEEMEEMEKKDAKALSIIEGALSFKYFTRIDNASTSKEAWDILKEEFHGDIKVRKIKLRSLKREFDYLRMKDSESLKDYYTKISQLVTQMEMYGEKITNERLCEKILNSLTPKYNSIIGSIEEANDVSTLSVQKLMGSLESHEERLNRQNEKSIESAFQSKLKIVSQASSSSQEHNKPQPFRGGMHGRGRGRNMRGRGRANFQRVNNDDSSHLKCNICKRSSHVENDCWFKGKPQCFVCKKFGHVAKDCRYNQSEQANYSEEKQEGNHSTLYSCQVASEQRNDLWFLDSGCSNHMTGDESIFMSLDTSTTSQVKMRNGAIVQSKGKGTIAIDTRKGRKFVNDVMLVPDLEHNLLSVGQLIEHGHVVHFEGNECKFFDKGEKQELMTTIKMEKNRNFPLYLRYAKEMAMKVNVNDDSWLWHKRFGHLNFQSLKALQSKNMVYGLPRIDEKKEVCEGCALGKQHRESFSKEKAW